MTIVLACVTSDAVYQISDRRLVDVATRAQVIDDEKNKAVLVNSRVAFGYTGLARIDGESTDTWLAKVIACGSTSDMAEVAERIRARATHAFTSMTIPKAYKRHAFQAVGWFQLRGEKESTPGIVVVHNALDEKTGSWLSEPLEEFCISTQFPTHFPGGCILNSVGVVPSAQEKSAVLRLARKALKRRDIAPNAILRALVESMTWLSGRHQEIGRGLMIVRLYRKASDEAAATGMHMAIAGAIDSKLPTFFYVSATGLTTHFGPHFVVGQSVLTDFQGGAL